MERLTKKQKEFLLACIGEGIETDEINARAAKFKPPFQVERQDVDYYRKSRGVKLREIVEAGEMEALRSGLALRAERVKRLDKLAEMIEKDLLDNKLLWLKRERALGSGVSTKFVEVDELNRAQINLLRDLYDDIAKEMHQRTYERRDSSQENEQPNEVKITVAYEDKKPIAE